MNQSTAKPAPLAAAICYERGWAAGRARHRIAPLRMLPLLYADDELVVVDKPAGLAVHRGWAPEPDVLVARLRAQLGQAVHAVHRLDRGASGALLVARNPAAARALCAEFAEGRVGKRYLALVRGIPPERVVIDHPVPRGEDRSDERVAAVSAVERLEIIGRYALVAVEPRTGRLHQIRRHLKHISCPILGDVNYGKGEHNRRCRTHYGLDRLFLHAEGLAFRHPTSGSMTTVHAPLAAELERVLAAMRADPPV